MPAYVIVEIQVEDPELYESYKKLSAKSLQEFNGEFLVRGGETLPLEGDWNPERLVLLRFKDIETAKAWWYSNLYTKAKVIRQQASKTKMIIVEGV